MDYKYQTKLKQINKYITKEREMHYLGNEFRRVVKGSNVVDGVAYYNKKLTVAQRAYLKGYASAISDFLDCE